MFFSYDGEYLSTVRLPEEDGGIHSIMKSPDQDLLAYYPMPNDYIKIEHEYKKVEIKGNRLKNVSPAYHERPDDKRYPLRVFSLPHGHL